MTSLKCGHLGNRCYACNGLDLPTGYRVEYHEARGYDSPDRWYEAHGPDRAYCDRFGTAKEAEKGCWDHMLHDNWFHTRDKALRAYNARSR